MITFSFTYEVVSPDSAEHGDVEESGFHREEKEWKPGDLKDALKEARDLGCNQSSTFPFSPEHHIWYYSIDGKMNYRTGEVTNYGFHIKGVTPSTMKRIARVLGVIE